MRLFQAPLDTPLDSPFFAHLSVHGLHFTVCAPSTILCEEFGRSRLKIPSEIENGGHLKPVTLKPVSRIFRIFRVFVSAFSAFSAFLLPGVSSDPGFCRGERGLPHFPHFSRIGFESLISKMRATGFIVTGLR